MLDFNEKVGFFRGIRRAAVYPDDRCKDLEPIR